MNFHWTQSKKYLLVIVASAAVLDGALTTLVVDQQHHPNTLTGPASMPTTADPRTADNHTRPGHLDAPDPHPTSAGTGYPQTIHATNSAPSTSQPAASSTSSTSPTTDPFRQIRSCGQARRTPRAVLTPPDG
jgi:hypothetical protein